MLRRRLAKKYADHLLGFVRAYQQQYPGLS